MKTSLKKQGFTLIEMALVMIIIGVIVSIAASIAPQFIQSGKIKKTQAIVDKNIYAIEGYLAANGRCPCPDTDGDSFENRDGDDSCLSFEGDIPYRTIGFSSGEDSWGTSLRYAVYDNCTRTTLTDLCSDLSSFAGGTYDGTLLHTDLEGTEINHAYAVISAGPDKNFDGKNSTLDMEYEVPGKIGDPDYDDILKVSSFTVLFGKHCSGNIIN